MKVTANVKPALIILILAFMVSSTAWAIPKPAPEDTTEQIDISKIIEKIDLEWPKDAGWASGWVHKGEHGGYMELFFPEGQSRNGWKEMITIEKVAGKRKPNLPGAARIIFKGTVQSCPDATWKILEKGTEDPAHNHILFEIRCPKFIADQPPEIQIWKLIVGRTGMFILQYSYRGEEMPQKTKEVMKKVFDSTKIITEQIEDKEIAEEG